MRRLASAAFLALAAISLTTEASAFQVLYEYRILGSEIGTVDVLDPGFEDPYALEIMMNQSDDRVVVESDGDLSECAERIKGIIGSKDEYVQIIGHASANTMNGVMVITCAIFSL